MAPDPAADGLDPAAADGLDPMALGNDPAAVGLDLNATV
jgi:hypothetical protein